MDEQIQRKERMKRLMKAIKENNNACQLVIRDTLEAIDKLEKQMYLDGRF